ncbi:uracil-DNA glycosylase family protein [Hankyongella ginsenosidimutans]|uniref:uracil-DNA glycosylase family protein n=1 Tax=Hankyongella ginsenosidimutans TaxID=1763828 RepID=UPI00319EA508
MAALDDFLGDLRACTLCAASLPHGPRPIVQIGHGARILLIGQAPGRKVHASGIPWDDASGDTLRGWLGLAKAAFYDPAQVALLPMGFCYPGTGKAATCRRGRNVRRAGTRLRTHTCRQSP